MAWSPWEAVVTCRPYRSIFSRGIWLKDNPFTFPGPVLMMQIAVASLFTGILDFLLRPTGLCSFFSQMLGAIILGPVGVGSIEIFGKSVFSAQSLYVLETFQNLAGMFLLFMVGLKTDIRIVKNTGPKALVIGTGVFIVPLITSIPISIYLKRYVKADGKLSPQLPMIAVTENLTSFHVAACLLADLKLLNSEIGRLAISSTMVSSGTSWVALTLILTAHELMYSENSPYMTLIKPGGMVFLAMIVVYVMRPIMLWMVRRTPEGRNMKEVHVFIIFLMVLLSSLFGQVTGQAAGLGPVMLGLAVPPGPPLAETLENKLGSIVTSILLPACYASTAGTARPRINMSSSGVTIVVFIIITSFLAKVIGTVLPSIYFNMPMQDAFVLGIVIGSQGIVDILHFKRSLSSEIVDIQVYSIMTYSSVVIAGITSLLVKYMYRPSARYMLYTRTLEENLHNTELRILTCVYREFNTPTLISLLEASHPTAENPIYLYLLNLIELQRIAPPLLISHKDNQASIYYKHTQHIINAFQFLESQYSRSIFSLNSFTAMSPCASMHQDICSLAYDKRVALIILPFHRQLNLDGLLESTNSFRTVNCNVLKTAPCSVGILIDRTGTNVTSCVWEGSKATFRVAVIFLGGIDDRGVLSYGMRMVNRHKTALSVLRFCVADRNYMMSKEKRLDAALLNEFKEKFMGDRRIQYREETVSDGIAIVKALRGFMEETFDLMMLGRQHGSMPALFQGMEEWNELPELGIMGDLVATSDSYNQSSILVLQQNFQSSGQDFLHRTRHFNSFSLHI